MRKPSRRTLVKKLDKVVSEYVRKRDKRCVVCGSMDRLGNSHVFSRGTYSTRWDVTPDGNCHCGCWPCNFRHVRDQYPYFEWYRKKFGQGKFEVLRRRFKTSRPWKDWELEELLTTLTTSDTIGA